MRDRGRVARLSVVIPTLGRPSLARTLASCADADQIVLVLDTAQGGHLPCEIGPNVTFTTGNFGVTGGHAGRVHGIGLATGTHLAFMDDDDEYTPGAIDLMREAACDVPVIFRMDHYAHGILWRDREVRFGNVSTQMYVVPNEPDKLGHWEPHIPGIPEPGGDYTFMVGCVQRMGGPVWREEIVAKLRPDIARAPSVAVVTPWLDHLELREDYFEALELGPHPSELIIVDNGSVPPLEFAALFPRTNLGYARGSNLGLEESSSDVVIFLNNDIQASEQGWLAKLVQRCEPGVLVGASLRYDAHADVDHQSLPYLDGWCLGGMRSDLLALGGFDETLEEPAYYSDNLLCLEARAQGMTLREVPIGLRHKFNATAGPASDPLVRKATEANRAKYVARTRELLSSA